MNPFDISLMLALNFNGGPAMDSLMWFASGKINWLPLYLFVLFLIQRRFGWKYMLFALLFIAAGVGICDQACNFFKQNIPYPRPSRMPELDNLIHIVNGYRGGGKATVSAHAATTFLIFLFSSLIIKRWWFTAIMLAYTLLVSYSRIYLGMHFPLQIFFGILLGAVIAIGLWLIFSFLDRRFNWSSNLGQRTKREVRPAR